MSSASGDDWQMPTSADLSQYRARLTCIFACRDRLCGINKIQKVMGRLGPFTWGRLGGPDIELAVHRHRVTVDDLSVESLSGPPRIAPSYHWLSGRESQGVEVGI